MNGFLKQPQQAVGLYLNYGVGQSVIGGQLTTAPSGTLASQGNQDIPGDRMMLDSADADALSYTTTGQLYGGTYQYVQTDSTSTASPTIGRLAFWAEDSATVANGYVVNPDEDDFIAGVFINSLTKGYYGWIQIQGQVDAFFVSTIASPTQGAGVYAARLGAGADVGGLTQFAGTYSNATNEEVDQMLNRYMGQAVELPVASALSLINIPLSRIRV